MGFDSKLRVTIKKSNYLKSAPVVAQSPPQSFFDPHKAEFSGADHIPLSTKTINVVWTRARNSTAVPCLVMERN